MQVPYVDLAQQHRSLKAELLEAVGKVIDHGQFILGPEVEELERRFAELCCVRHAVAVNSGTDALILALRALHIGPGDEVITAPNSFIASASCIAIVGARPVFADVGDDLNLDPAEVAAAITSRTKAILAVHLTGRPARMDAIREIADRHRLAIVEDAAQAVLARYQDRPVGSLGTAGCFSLHPLKTLNACGDGGILTTDDDRIAEFARLARNLGLRTREDCVLWSSNSRLDTVQAAMVLVKLRYVERWTERRRENAARYRGLLNGISQLALPADTSEMWSVYHTFVVLAERRDALQAFLRARGVQTAIHYPIPAHLQTVARELRLAPGSFPVAEAQASRLLSLPIHPDLDEAMQRYVADTIREFYGGDAT